MTPVITAKKLNIYNSYNGDEDGFARANRNAEKAEFAEGNAWGLIRAAYANLDMIDRGLCSDGFTREIIMGLKENCDEDGFKILTARLKFYKHFQAAANILQKIKEKINSSNHRRSIRS
jgi:hypothetical protein